MGGFNSKAQPKRPEITQVDRAVLDLKNARNRLSQYQRKLASEEEKLIERARQAKQEGKTKVALQLLKIKKIKNNEIESVNAQLLNVEQMVQTINSKQNETQVLQAMKAGKDSLQKMHEETSVDYVLDLMDSIKEQNEIEHEISHILQGVPSLSVQDEADVEKELEALMAAEQQTNNPTAFPEVPDSTPMPVVPTAKPSRPEAKQQEAAVPS